MKINRIILFGFMFSLIISTPLSVAAVDQSLVGVKNGEEYTYILEKYYIYAESPNRNTRTETVDYLYGNEGFISLVDGDEFTYRIVNSTLYDRSVQPIVSNGTVTTISFSNPFAIKVEIVGPNGTVISDNLEIGFGGILSETNWTGWKTTLEEGKESFENLENSNPDMEYIYEIIDINNEFGFKFGSAFSGNDTDPEPFSDIREIRYEKKTGMLTLMNIDNNKAEIEGNMTYNTERTMILKRKGFNADNGETLAVPGFTLYLSVTALFVLIYQRKK